MANSRFSLMRQRRAIEQLKSQYFRLALKVSGGLLAVSILVLVALREPIRSTRRASFSPPSLECNEVAERRYLKMSGELTKYLREERLKGNRQKMSSPTRLLPSALNITQGQLAMLGDKSQGQVEAILRLLNFKQNGTYFEAGANDGITESNTLALETMHGWTGLLVEPVPWLFDKLLAAGRRGMFLDVCLSLYPFPFIASMTVSKDKNHTMAQELGTIDKVFKKNILKPETIRVDCFPIENVLEAAGLSKGVDGKEPPLLDVMILDLQGLELSVLKTIPWEKVRIELLVVENNFEETKKHQEHLQDMTGYLSSVPGNGYAMVGNVAKDYIFQRRRP